MTIGKRIKKLRGETSIAEFCRMFDIHRNTLPRYESDARSPGADFLSMLCNHYKVNAEWLLMGTGPEKMGDKPRDEINIDILTDAIAALEQALEQKGRHMEPAAKAEIISEIYQLFIDDESEGEKSQNIARLLRLVV